MLRSLGLQISYDQLMFLGGGAFRISWSSQWTSEAAFACGEDIIANAARSQGCTATSQFPASLEETWKMITASIEAGTPPLTSGALSRSDWAVIVGYEDSPRRLLLRDLPTQSVEPVAKTFEEWRGWTYAGGGKFPLITLKRVGKVMDDIQATAEALDRAVRFNREVEFTMRGGDGSEMQFYSGARAYQEFARSAATIAVGANGEALAARLALMNLTIKTIIDARKSAIENLEVVKRRGSRQTYDMTVAVDRYASEVAVLEQALMIGGSSVIADAITVAGEEDNKAVAALWRVLKKLD